jgi:L-seryl-tRNA(Ser) seleniumtransferase
MDLRGLPSVEELLIELRGGFPSYPHALLLRAARSAVAAARMHLREGKEPPGPLAAAASMLERLGRTSLQPVINATGVILHTNLGRAPLGDWTPIRGYSNLEYNLAAGRRGQRDDHCQPILEALLDAPAIAVNNNAAAVYLVLHELAAGGEVIVSRGELIEIGDGFRIPEIMRRAGVTLVEVGTTNRTHLDDYRSAITGQTKLLLRVHPSNFHMTGFTGRPSLEDLVGLGREKKIPLYEDLGSGCVVDLKPFGIDEPLVRDSLAAGVDIVSFSGDKLMGGPQAGLIAGNPELVRRIRRNPMFRALRLDKLVLQALEATLRDLLLQRYESLPAIGMIRQSAEEIRMRAASMVTALPGAAIVPGESVIGGGSTPDRTLPTFLIALPGTAHEIEKRLRLGMPPVIARVDDDRLLIDLRTVFPEEETLLLNRARQAVEQD